MAVVIPTFNEAETISALVEALFAYPFISQVVVVDDSPNDLTVSQLTNFDDKRLVVIQRKQKAGRGSAVMEGICKVLSISKPDLIIEMDADFSHQPKEIPGLINKILACQAGLVVASRYLPGSKINNWPIKRKLFSKISNKFAQFLLRIPIADYTNGFRIYTYSAANLLLEKPLLGTGFIALSDVLVRIYYHGFLITEIPTVFNNRTRGESALCFKEISNAFFGIFKIYFYAKRFKKNNKQVIKV
ncbi:MAG: hypothetical protein A3E87_07505 [Gammaproteobacteria bacterium RIFCSPHIGHO2_12_FULL_35_23]|nr:MAG: hypothetical protein A3E87_07505 [Gammaproteobacteria bacterium RIFCSPHIGHO2_12_FULL_35_23]